MLTLTEAFRRATIEGVECRLMVGVAERSRVLRVSVSTSDADPMLTLAVDDGREELLSDREQSAPDRWDYFSSNDELAAKHFVRLSRGGAHRDVVLLNAARAIIATHGWTNDESLVAEAMVDAGAFDRALIQLLEEIG